MIKLSARTGITIAGAAALAALSAPAAAQLATANSTLPVTALVTANCTLSTTPLAFGNVDTTNGADHDANASLIVLCTNGISWTASAGVGAGSGASYGSRRMASGANQLAYNIFTSAARTTVFGDGTGSTATIAGTGSGVPQTVSVYGRVGGGQTSVPIGAYADTVAVTVTY